MRAAPCSGGPACKRDQPMRTSTRVQEAAAAMTEDASWPPLELPTSTQSWHSWAFFTAACSAVAPPASWIARSSACCVSAAALRHPGSCGLKYEHTRSKRLLGVERGWSPAGV
eukprot:CAMPEP_0179202374 /NCGR_PEP_ID=MMETSP0796-20121207/100802_1 /TAXON_ID=73915 /ORGANISM="Pyrodinium bahamense, Strain pbaha01" /LENGTH=112 /DNA_ID=CAMNT_0020907093 /DNA_START=216 /DNA_END=555 /DNA_ORIENTATION=-